MLFKERRSNFTNRNKDREDDWHSWLHDLQAKLPHESQFQDYKILLS